MGLLLAGIDIGGTRTRSALASADAPASILARRERMTPRAGVEPVLEAVTKDIAACRAELGEGNLVAAGCTAPGMTDPERGLVLEAANLPGWDAVPLRSLLRDRLGVQVAVENDVNAAAIAESAYGHAAASRSAVYVTVSTGIAAGIIADGKLLRGSHYSAGELGSLVPEPRHLDRDWRPNGCLESLAAGVGLARAWKSAGDKSGARHVFESAAAGNEEAAALVRRTCDYLAQALIAVACVIDPEILILGGSIALNQPSLAKGLRRRLQRALPFPPALAYARFGEDNPLVGALAMAAALTDARASYR